jgi:hypothetical protein
MSTTTSCNHACAQCTLCQKYKSPKLQYLMPNSYTAQTNYTHIPKLTYQHFSVDESRTFKRRGVKQPLHCDCLPSTLHLQQSCTLNEVQYFHEVLWVSHVCTKWPPKQWSLFLYVGHTTVMKIHKVNNNKTWLRSLCIICGSNATCFRSRTIIRLLRY